MPTYAYTCTECGHAFDIHQSFSDAALTECPACGGRLRKVFSSVGVVFKGSGFYRNDSRASASGGSGPKESGSKDSGSKGSGSKESNSSSSSTSKKSDGSSSYDVVVILVFFLLVLFLELT